MPIASHEIGPALIKALGLPRNTSAFTLRAQVGRFVTVECEYYPDDGGIVAALAEYDLVARTKPQDGDVLVHLVGEAKPRIVRAKPAPHPAEVIGFDAWMRERTEAAHQEMMARVRQSTWLRIKGLV